MMPNYLVVHAWRDFAFYVIEASLVTIAAFVRAHMMTSVDECSLIDPFVFVGVILPSDFCLTFLIVIIILFVVFVCYLLWFSYWMFYLFLLLCWYYFGFMLDVVRLGEPLFCKRRSVCSKQPLNFFILHNSVLVLFAWYLVFSVFVPCKTCQSRRKVSSLIFK